MDSQQSTSRSESNATTIPLHVAIIMDGNGRWASKRGLPRTEGHSRGLTAAKRVVAAASNMGIRYLSLYTFSTENWKRTQDEVGFLMSLVKNHLSKELDFYRQNKIKVVHSGRRDGLAPDILTEIDSIVRDTEDFPGMVVNLAINYGGRDELSRAFDKAFRTRDQPAENDRSRQALSWDERIRQNLDHPEIPDPDLIIRTGGELRLSNFLLWQSAYSELFFSDCLWPDYSESDLKAAIDSYILRDRRFGGAK